MTEPIVTFPQGTTMDNSEPGTLVDLLSWRANHQPDKKGYIFWVDEKKQEVSLTYKELDRRARAIGAWLQSAGAAGNRVLLQFPSGLDYIAAFFGCLYAGAVAVPVYPPRPNRSLGRIQTICNDARPVLALTTSHFLPLIEPLLKQASDLEKLPLRAVDAIKEDLAEEWQKPSIVGHTLAFLQYTSGSTALPKGVMVNHKNILHNERMIKSAFRQTEQSIIVGWLPLFHDMGLIGQVLQTLYAGAQCILLSPISFLQRPLSWLEVISRYRATTSGGPNFAYDLCARNIRVEQRCSLDLSSWNVAYCGSEPVQKSTLDRFASAFAPYGFRWEALCPCYGLAEATLFVSGPRESSGPTFRLVDRKALDDNRVIPASIEDHRARNLTNCGGTCIEQEVRIVDPNLCTECPPDRVGEIWLRGPSITRGYWNRPDESWNTFHAYLADTGQGPFLRTGDLGFIDNGQLYITGRLKDLIIIRGRNHYPEDIEQTVQQSHPELRPGSCAAFSIDITGQEELVVVVEKERGKQGQSLEEIIGAIRQAVSEEHELQVYAVALVKPGNVPKTSSGKTQRHACRLAFLAGKLAAIATDVLSTVHDEHHRDGEGIFNREDILSTNSAGQRQSKLENCLLQQVALVLKMDPSRVSLQEPLARFGLDSLKALELQNKIESNLGVSLSMARLLQDISISQLALLVESELPRSVPAPVVVGNTQVADGANHPLSYGQYRLWFSDQLESGNPAYNISLAFRFVGYLSVFALEQSISEIVARHEALRTIFAIDKGLPTQVINPPDRVTVPVVQIRRVCKLGAVTLASEDAQRSFDLAKGPLYRANLLSFSEEEHVLLLSFHHIIVDGWSVGVFLRELAALYQSYLAGDVSPLPKLPTQYVDFACWQRQRLQGDVLQGQLSYWKQRFAVPQSRLDLPTDRPRRMIPTNRGASHQLKLSKRLSEALKTLSCREGSTLFMALLTAFNVVLHCRMGQNDIFVGSPTSGRNRAEFEKLIGFFLNTLVLRTNVSDNPTLRDLLHRVRHVALEAYANQDLPFERLVAEVAPERNLNRSPLYQVWFVLQVDPIHTIKLPALSLSLLEVDVQTTKFDLALDLSDSPEGIRGRFEYNRDLFDAATIMSLSRDFEGVLDQMTREMDFKLDALKKALLQEDRRQRIEEMAKCETILKHKFKKIGRRIITSMRDGVTKS
jgi:acyl-CoA synthetase (AMP-forming)/AMP-acid ligase II